jgi:hypothetical protein
MKARLLIEGEGVDDAMFRLAYRFGKDHPDRKSRDVVIYTDSHGYVDSRYWSVWSCHWTDTRALVVVRTQDPASF